MDIYLIITILGYVSPTLCQVFTTTTGSISCPAGIPNGTITTGCSRTVSSYCTYWCDYSWCSKRFGWLFCNQYGSWSAADKACLCEGETTTTEGPAVCPYFIPNGRMISCDRQTPASQCFVVCNMGCRATTARLTCDLYGRWLGGDTACNCTEVTTTPDPDLCPNRIPNGRLISCSRQHYTTCRAICDTGCRATTYSLICDSYGNWIGGDTACNCSEVTTTPDSELCPYHIPNGRMMSCSRQRYTTCRAFCDTGCRATTHSLTCDSYGNWTGGDTACNCSVQSTVWCPGYIPHGSIVYYCSLSPQSYCKYTCYHSGCTAAFPSLLCLWNGTWLNGDTACICKEVTITSETVFCPSRIPNGNMFCSRQRFTTCRPSCDIGCRATTSPLTCDSHGNWIGGDTACNCSDQRTDRCPLYIPNGSIDYYCDRSAYSSCKYTCHFGCLRNFASLQCSWIGNWLSGDTACTCKAPVLCPKEIDNGHVKDSCSRKDWANCTFNCADNCDRDPKVNSLLCRNGTWYSARRWTMDTENPCICDLSANDSVSKKTSAVTAGILCGAAFLVIIWITVCIIAIIRKRRQMARSSGGSATMTACSQQPPEISRTRATEPRTAGASLQRAGVQNGVSSPIYMLSNTVAYQSVQYTASQNSCYLVPEATSSNGSAYPDAPPSYSSIAAVKSEESPPPPSYEEAVSLPTSPTT